MPKLIIPRGLPGSGKSTWAKQWVNEDPENRIRVNRDDLRKMLFNKLSGLTFDQENRISAVEKNVVKGALKDGYSVVIDATNLNAKFVKDWLKLANEYGAEVEFNDEFLSVPLVEVIARDSLRPVGDGFVGPDVIKRFYDRYLSGGRSLPVPEINAEPILELKRYASAPGKPRAVLVDLDGTIADMAGARGPFEWDKVGNDRPKKDVIQIIWGLEELGIRPIFISGREDVCYDLTLEWINEHVKPHTQPILHMRKAKDGRKDSIIKYEIFDEHIRHNYDVVLCLDDRDQVVKMYRDLGLTVAQVNYGNF